MLDILAEALIELFNPKPKQPPPRRRAQSAPPPEEGAWLGQDGGGERHAMERGEAAPARKAMTLQDVVRQMAGLDEPSPPPRSAKPRREPRKQAGQARRPAPEPVRVAQPAAAAPKPRPAKPSKPAARPQSVSDTDYAAKLRGNPIAAREAFVYSEIFGRPLADRSFDQR